MTEIENILVEKYALVFVCFLKLIASAVSQNYRIHIDKITAILDSEDGEKGIFLNKVICIM